MVDIAAAEAKRSFPAGLKDIEEGKLNNVKKWLLATAALLLMGGAVAVGVFLLNQKKEEQTAHVLPRPIISADEELEIGADEIKDILLFPAGENKLLYFPIKETENIGEFFSAIGVSPPPGLIDALEDGFMLAAFQKSQKWPILILRVGRYEHGFVAMLKWERTMVYDLEKIFGLDAGSARDYFEDKEIRNNDARILNNTEGNPILIYSFFNRKYLVITTGEPALKEALRRLSSVQYLNE